MRHLKITLSKYVVQGTSMLMINMDVVTGATKRSSKNFILSLFLLFLWKTKSSTYYNSKVSMTEPFIYIVDLFNEIVIALDMN